METEAQVRAELTAVDAQLQLLERPPKMIFDVETEEGQGRKRRFCLNAHDNTHIFKHI